MALNRHNLRTFLCTNQIMSIIKQLVVNSKEEYYHERIYRVEST